MNNHTQAMPIHRILSQTIVGIALAKGDIPFSIRTVIDEELGWGTLLTPVIVMRVEVEKVFYE